MTEAELENLDIVEERPRRVHFEWLLPTFFRPRRTLAKIAEQNHAVWITPLLVLSLLAIVAVLAASPVRQLAAQMGSEIPPDFEWWSPEQQQQFMEAQANSSGPMFTIVFPALGAVLGLWVSWFLLGSILHLSLTLAGSRSSNTAALNLVGWASLPYALRSLVQIVGMLLSRSVINAPGLSGFAAEGAAGAAAFAGALLAFVDLYLIWQIILLLVGVVPVSRLARGKAWAAVFISLALILLISAVPALIAAQLGGLSGGGMIPFF